MSVNASFPTLMKWTALLAAVAGLSYLAMKSVFLSSPAVDFPYIWLAGDLWREGINPYSTDFEAAGKALITDGAPPQIWFYPPSWWPIATGVSVLPLDSSLMVWRALSAILLVAGTLGAAWLWSERAPAARVAAALAYACLMSATPIALSLGQTSFLSYAGVAMFLVAVHRGYRVAMVLALVLLMLKPQIGLPFCLYLLPVRYWWPSLGVAGVLSVAFAVPALALSGLEGFVSAYLEQLGAHEKLLINHPIEMTGLRILAYETLGVTVTGLTLTLGAACAAAVLALLQKPESRGQPVAVLALLLLVIGITPLHTYDMMLVVPFIILSHRFNIVSQCVLWCGLLLIMRSNNLADLTGFYDSATTTFTGSRIASIGLLLLGMAIAMEALHARRERRTDHLITASDAR